MVTTEIHPNVDFIEPEKNGDSAGHGRYNILVSRDTYLEDPERYITGIARAIYSHSNKGKLLDTLPMDLDGSGNPPNGRTINLSSASDNTLTMHGYGPLINFAYRLEDMSETSEIHNAKYKSEKDRRVENSEGVEQATKGAFTLSGLLAGAYLGINSAIKFGNTVFPNTGQEYTSDEITFQIGSIIGVAALVTAGVGWIGDKLGRMTWNGYLKSKYNLARDHDAIRTVKRNSIGNATTYSEFLMERSAQSQRTD